MTKRESLKNSLESFRESLTSHKQLMAMAAGWDREILIEPTDKTEAAYALRIEKGQVTFLEEKDGLPEHPQIHLRGSSEKLLEIFSGQVGPVEAYFDGQLEVYADDQDQVKLDAIALILWGI